MRIFIRLVVTLVALGFILPVAAAAQEYCRIGTNPVNPSRLVVAGETTHVLDSDRLVIMESKSGRKAKCLLPKGFVVVQSSSGWWALQCGNPFEFVDGPPPAAPVSTPVVQKTQAAPPQDDELREEVRETNRLLRELLENRATTTAQAEVRNLPPGYSSHSQAAAPMICPRVGEKVKFGGQKYECQPNPFTGQSVWVAIGGGNKWYKSGRFWIGTLVGAGTTFAVCAATSGCGFGNGNGDGGGKGDIVPILPPHRP